MSPRWTLLLAALLPIACKDYYRVGDRVAVHWCEGTYPAYIIARKSPTRVRVHFEDYDSRWDTEIPIDDVVKRLDAQNQAPPPMCPKVARALGLGRDANQGAAGPQAGARIKVTWRGSVYRATVVKVLGTDRFLVHYEGHTSAWDEVVGADRIVN